MNQMFSKLLSGNEIYIRVIEEYKYYSKYINGKYKYNNSVYLYIENEINR